MNVVRLPSHDRIESVKSLLPVYAYNSFEYLSSNLLSVSGICTAFSVKYSGKCKGILMRRLFCFYYFIMEIVLLLVQIIGFC